MSISTKSGVRGLQRLICSKFIIYCNRKVDSPYGSTLPKMGAYVLSPPRVELGALKINMFEIYNVL